MGSDEGRADPQGRAKARQAEGERLAASLVGLDREDAVGRTRERGFDPDVVPHTVDAITMDLRHNRIRIFLDETDTVIRAWAG